jgi:hypothetical protein
MSSAFLVVVEVRQADLLKPDFISFAVFPRLSWTGDEFGIRVDAI